MHKKETNNGHQKPYDILISFARQNARRKMDDSSSFSSSSQSLENSIPRIVDLEAVEQSSPKKSDAGDSVHGYNEIPVTAVCSGISTLGRLYSNLPEASAPYISTVIKNEFTLPSNLAEYDKSESLQKSTPTKSVSVKNELRSNSAITPDVKRRVKSRIPLKIAATTSARGKMEVLQNSAKPISAAGKVELSKHNAPGRGNILMPKSETDLRAERAQAKNSVITNSPVGKYYQRSVPRRKDAATTKVDAVRMSEESLTTEASGTTRSISRRLTELCLKAELSTPEMDKKKRASKTQIPEPKQPSSSKRKHCLLTPRKRSEKSVALAPSPVFHKLYGLILDIYEHFVKPDLEIHISGNTYFVYRDVLRAFSDMQELRYLPKIIHIHSEKIHPEAFKLAYQWMNGKELSVLYDMLIPFFNVVDYFKLMDLQKQCWMYIDAHKHLSGTKRPPPLLLKCQTMGLQSICIELISKSACRYFLSIVALDAFSKLSLEEVNLLFSQPGLCVNDEKEVFLAAFLWLKADWDVRQKHLEEVIGLIHHPMLADNFFKPKTDRDRNTVIHAVINHPQFEVVREISKAHNRDFSRKWINDKRAKYYLMDEDANVFEFYDYFLKYLDVLKTEFRKTKMRK